ncbi:actin-like protein, putative [Plasmodium reichenowi]|uniref:Actin-like protein, putative n=1 Tax=Plasmodium reichenowi TaxID=5854 RepID=A0A060RR52_PLARE|nr:actin-like protein, putative [Plasmodium reichenowi]
MDTYKKNDNENDYKYYVLQIGRKYTYVGLCGLHKPISVFVTPNIFVYNEKFHNFVEDTYKVNEMMDYINRKREEQYQNEKSEKMLDVSKDQSKEDIKIVTDNQTDECLDKYQSSDNLDYNNEEFVCDTNNIYENNKFCDNEKKHNKMKIYHYEYKYNQDLYLWRTYFDEYIFHIFHNIFIKTNNKSKKVILVLNMFIPTIIKYALCISLIENPEYACISYINDLISPLYLCNYKTCVVIDLGYINCRILPIMDGVPLYHHYTYVNNGGFYINQEIKKLLKEQYMSRYKKRENIISTNGDMKLCLGNYDNSKDDDNKNDDNKNDDNKNDDNKNDDNKNDDNKNDDNKNDDNNNDNNNMNYYLNLYPLEEIINVINNMTDDDIEIIKIKYCYIKKDSENIPCNKYVLYKYNNYDIIIDPYTRYKACEILFEKEYDQNMYSLFSSIVQKINIFETYIFSNILLVGGCSNIKGILSRVAQIFFQVLRNEKKFPPKFQDNVHFLLSNISPNLRQFVGASICSSMDNLPDYTAEEILNNVLYDHLNEDIYMTFKT